MDVSPTLHRLEPAPDRAPLVDFLATVNTRGFYDPVDDLDFWVMASHYEGFDTLPVPMQEAVKAEEIRRLSDEHSGFAYFIRWYGMVRIKGGCDRGWRRMCPDGMPRVSETTGRDWGWQLLLAEAITEYDVFLVLKARQIGLTFIAAHYGLWRCMFFNDTIGIVIANKMTSAKRLVRRVLDIYRHLPTFVQEAALITNDGIQRMEWANGSSLEPMSAASDTGRSEAAGFVLIDEAAIIRPITRQEDVWGSVEACADGGGQIVMFTTANGIGDLVHTWVTDSVFGKLQHVLALDDDTTIDVTFGEAEMGFCFLPYSLHPDRDTAWHEKKRRMYRGSLSKFDQEYPETWEQAFIASGLNYFSVVHVEEEAHRQKSALAAYTAEHNSNRDVRGSLIWKDRVLRLVEFVPDPYGVVVIHGLEDFYLALQSGRPFVIGADCAGDAPWGDFQAATSLHVGTPYQDADEEIPMPPKSGTPHRQLLTIHGQIPADEYGETLAKAGYLCHQAVIAVEANGVGTAVISNLRRLKYPRMYMRPNSSLAREHKTTERIGWWSNSDTKNNAFGTTDKYLREGALEIRDLETLDEMRGVVHLGGRRIGAPEPRHDDRVAGLTIAAALATRAARSLVLNVVVDDDPIMKVLAEIEAESNAQSCELGNEMLYV